MSENQDTKIPKNKLRELRILPRISQWKLAAGSGVKQSRISLIENRLVTPTAKEKEKLAHSLNHTIEEIFQDDTGNNQSDSNGPKTD